MQYLVLIHRNSDSSPSAEEWGRFFDAAKATGMFQGGSVIGSRQAIGRKPVADTTDSVAGYMRFDADNESELLSLLEEHPVVRRGGTIELCELPES